MIELYGDNTGNCIRAAIALEEAGLAHEIRKIDLARREQQGESYRSVNPLGRIPALVETTPGSARLVLTQSNAIMMYAAERSGRLLSNSGPERNEAMNWYFLFLTDVIGPNHAAFRLRQALGEEPSRAAAAELERRAISVYGAVNDHLRGREFLASGEPTIADIAGFTITSALTRVLGLDELPEVLRWHRQLALRPAFQRGMSAFR